MTQTLVPGQNCPVPASLLSVSIRAGAAADFSAFRLFAGGKTRRDEDFVFYGQKRNDDGTISLSHDACSGVFSVDLARLAPDVEKVALAVTSDFPTVARLSSLTLEAAQGAECLLRCSVEVARHDEAALILGEFYRRNGQWKFRFVAQGFRGGLKPLAEFYGVDVADDAPAPAPSPAPGPAPSPVPPRPASSGPAHPGPAASRPAPAGASAPSPVPAPSRAVNLGKIVLTKASPRIDLTKHTLAGGMYRVNLNWNRAFTSRPSGLAGLFNPNRGIDLDLAAYVLLKNGDQTIVQALGERFGSLEQPPFVKLMGDDRTGSQADGEWIHINGDRIDELAEIIIFTFIYAGAPNWNATDAVVRVDIPGQPKIETRLADGNEPLPMCAIARITNSGGKLSIERLERYFRGHEEMDRFFGWGFKWRAGWK
ncbi:TerD family protein [uncultured Desulfovibrio sp.]|uniref:TerD family protein n=1 Tax=uncultured Desulfovibrio sp. TaxID=167968 RepID=UPI00262802D5|nr:TerD family protein [uncultured Desulfovibrio sp.]